MAHSRPCASSCERFRKRGPTAQRRRSNQSRLDRSFAPTRSEKARERWCESKVRKWRFLSATDNSTECKIPAPTPEDSSVTAGSMPARSSVRCITTNSILEMAPVRRTQDSRSRCSSSSGRAMKSQWRNDGNKEPATKYQKRRREPAAVFKTLSVELVGPAHEQFTVWVGGRSLCGGWTGDDQDSVRH